MYSIAKGENDEKVKLRYAHKAAENIGLMTQYLVFTTWGFIVLKNSLIMPWFMGGNFDGPTAFANCFTTLPYNEVPREIYIWFLYSSGPYFGELVAHLFWDERRNDFGEMLLHHLATILLVFGSAYANMVAVGAIISWLHIVSDWPCCLLRALSSTVYEKTTVFCYVSIMLTTFLYFRLVCLPYWVFSIVLKPEVVAYPEDLSHYNIFLRLNGVYLLFIQALQVYWYGLFLKILYEAAVYGKTED